MSTSMFYRGIKRPFNENLNRSAAGEPSFQLNSHPLRQRLYQFCFILKTMQKKTTPQDPSYKTFIFPRHGGAHTMGSMQQQPQ